MAKVIREKGRILRGSSSGRYCMEECSLGNETIKEIRAHVRETGHEVYELKEVLTRWRLDDGGAQDLPTRSNEAHQGASDPSTANGTDDT